MADNYRSPWADAGSAFSGVGNTVNDIVMGLAQQRAQMAQQQAQNQYRQQQAQQQAAEFQQSLAVQQAQQRAQQKHYESQAPVLAAEALLNQNKARGMQEQSDAGFVLKDIIQHIVENPQDPDIGMYRGAAAGRVAQIGATDPSSVAKQTMQASFMNDPSMRALIAAGGINNLQNNAPAGSTVFGPDGIVGSAGYNLGQGQTRFPAQVGSPAPQIGPSATAPHSPLNQLAQPIAQGLPPRESMVDPAQRDLASANNAIRNALQYGEGEQDANYGPATNLAAQALSQILQKYKTGPTNRLGLAAPDGNAEATSPPPLITTKEQFDALPSGAVYVERDGKTYQKP